MADVKQEVLVDVELTGKLLDVVAKAILLGKQQLLLELATLVEEDEAHSFKKAWHVLDNKYREPTIVAEQCEGCSSPVAKHEDTEPDASGSVRRSITVDGNVCCSHLPPKAPAT
jgi:DNA/RNA endonuclease YhcR with UshA esterase domain